MFTYEFDITDEVITKSEPLHSRRCPIANSINYSMTEVNVGYNFITFNDSGDIKIIPINLKLNSIIRRYDMGHEMKPFHLKFRLNNKNKWITSIRYL